MLNFWEKKKIMLNFFPSLHFLDKPTNSPLYSSHISDGIRCKNLSKITLTYFCTAIYSGDYKWFESESEDEIESESPTGTPTHDRTPCPSEAEGDQTETKETGDKGITQ